MSVSESVSESVGAIKSVKEGKSARLMKTPHASKKNILYISYMFPPPAPNLSFDISLCFVC